jgi:hypothetical protein
MCSYKEYKEVEQLTQLSENINEYSYGYIHEIHSYKLQIGNKVKYSLFPNEEFIIIKFKRFNNPNNGEVKHFCKYDYKNCYIECITNKNIEIKKPVKMSELERL